MLLPKVELHLHLEGAVKHETVLDLARQKNIKLATDDLEELKKMLICYTPKTLEECLGSFAIHMPAILGDPDAIERIAYELCEIQSQHGVLYFEVRYCPQFLSNTVKNEFWKGGEPYRGKGDVTPDLAVQCVNRGLKRGQNDFKIKARSILCCITGYPEFSDEILSLVTKYRDEGVVGIDVAGSGDGCDEVMHHTYEIFQATEHMCAERIGHGYRVIDDKDVYQFMKDGGYHFETCPLSSILTSSVIAEWRDHAVKVFADDNVNFSINTDDPTVFGNTMESEFKLCLDEIGLTYDQLYNCQINAAKSCFLPEDEKVQLVEQIQYLWKRCLLENKNCLEQF